MKFDLARMLGAAGMIAVAAVFLRLAMAVYSADPAQQPALPVLLPFVACAAFALGAGGMLVNGIRGAAAVLLTVGVLSLPLVLIFLLLDLRFLDA